MDDEADIVLIDTHAECRGCDDDIVADFVRYPFVLTLGALFNGETSVVGSRTNILCAEARSQGVAVRAIRNVNNS